MIPTFQGEVQFRRWSDSSTQGVQVTFALPDSTELEPLKGLEGKRFMAVLVRIGDDEQPLDPGSDPIQKPRRKDTRGPLCREACDYCELPEFWAWITADCPDYGPIPDEATARQWVLDTCQIKTRKALDTDSHAAQDFKKYVRIPFMRWQRERATR